MNTINKLLTFSLKLLCNPNKLRGFWNLQTNRFPSWCCLSSVYSFENETNSDFFPRLIPKIKKFRAVSGSHTLIWSSITGKDLSTYSVRFKYVINKLFSIFCRFCLFSLLHIVAYILKAKKFAEPLFGQFCGKFKFFCGIVGVTRLAFRMYGHALTIPYLKVWN